MLPGVGWFLIFLFVCYFLYLYADKIPKESYQNYADAQLWPFNRILLPIHYWLAQFHLNNYGNHPYYDYGSVPPVLTGPWNQLTH